ncbi:hypothetical protein KKG72_09925 [bacterium]|nr:hypothetical protein [bacterium]MBU1995366.1 hypothetical protein [bacterium]
MKTFLLLLIMLISSLAYAETATNPNSCATLHSVSTLDGVSATLDETTNYYTSGYSALGTNIYLKFTPTVGGALTISEGNRDQWGGTSSQMQVKFYVGSSCGGNDIISSGGSSYTHGPFTFTLTANQTYYIHIDKKTNDYMRYALTYSFTASSGGSTPAVVADEIIPVEEALATTAFCGTFEDVLQTRSNPSNIHQKSGAGAALFNTPDCSLNTGSIIWSVYQELSCDGGIATSTGNYGEQLNVLYTNVPDTATITNNPAPLASSDVSLSASKTFTLTEYNTINMSNNGITGLNLSFSALQKLNTLNLTINNNVTFSTPEPYNLEIGTIGIQSDGTGNSFTTSTIPKNIKINSLILPGNTNIDFEASQTIKMQTLRVGRAGTNVALKAQYVQINTLNQSSTATGSSNVEIIADYVDIGTLQLDETASITFKPYTPGKRILFKANSILASSTSTIVLYSGNYYTTSFTIPGSTNVSSIRAYDSNQLINMYINGDFTPGNNPGINTTGVNGSYDTSLPAANFVLFVQGSLVTGGGGTTFNATVYVEGSVDFGSPTYFTGAISSYGDIEIGNLSKFYFDQSIDESGWGACSQYGVADPNYEQCGVFPSALNTWDMINAANGDVVISADIIYADGINGSVKCSDTEIYQNASQLDACSVSVMSIDVPSLPVHVSSSLSTASDISGTLSAKEYPHLNIVGDTRFQATQSYSTSDRKYMSIKSITGTDADITLTFTEGDYYFDSWSSNARLIVRTEGKVRFFIDGDMILNNNTLDFNYNNNTGIASDMYIFIGGNFAMTTSGGGSGYNMVAYIFAKGTFDAGTNTNNSSFRGAVSSVGSITLNNNQIYTYDGSGLDASGFGSCGGSSTVYITGSLDAWDTVLDTTPVPPSIRTISTKIVNKPFNLSLASLNSTNDAYATKAGIGNIDVAIYPNGLLTPISNTITFDASTVDHIPSSSDFTVTSAVSDAVVGFKICATYEYDAAENDTIYRLYSSTSCLSATIEACDTQTNGTPSWHICSASDHFAIRPDRFVITAPAGENINFLKSGVNYNFPLTAARFGDTTPSSGYTVSTANTVLNLLKTAMYQPDGVTVDNTLLGAPAFGTDFNITNGDAVNGANINFSDVGKVTLQMQDTTWTNIDIGDTPADCTASGRYVCGSVDATFIPDHFTLTNVHLNNHNTNTFTYLSNDLAMSAHLDVTIEAQNALNNKTSNFKTLSWENPVNVSIAVATAGTPTLIKDEIDEGINLNFTAGALTIPWNTADASKMLRFNFQRTLINPVNPFRVNGADVILTASSIYGALVITSAATPADLSATFIHGRTNAPRQTFVGNSGNALLYYEAFCNGVGCDKTLLPNGATSAYNNDSRWFTNTLHTVISGTAGNVNQTKSRTDVTGTDTSGGHPDSTTVTYEVGEEEYPYKTTMQNFPSTWLLYNKYNAGATANEFEVEFHNAAGSWAGAHETNTTTVEGGSTITNRRSMW